jgi:hypothetical protein
MAETRKAHDRRARDGWFDRYCPVDRPGIDIGCGDDPVHPTFRRWDKADGDATFLRGVPDGAFWSVYSSHLLEHLDDPETALRSWWRVLAPGGCLTVVVPAMDVYEVSDELPSRWNGEHVTYWRLAEARPGDGDHVRGLLGTVVRTLPGAEIIWTRMPDVEPRATPDRHAGAEYSIEIVVRKPGPVAGPFDIVPYLDPNDEWVGREGLATVRRIYTEKYALATLLKPRSVVEIGVCAGYSAAAFLAAGAESYTGYDTGGGADGGYAGATDYARRMLSVRFPDRAAHIFEADSRHLGGLPVADLCHIDGGHDFETCRNDLQLAEGGYRWLLVDDYDFLPAVRRATDAFLSARPHLQRIHLPTVRGDCLIRVAHADG